MSLIRHAAGLLSSESKWVKRKPFDGKRMCLWGAIVIAAEAEGRLDHADDIEAAGDILYRVIKEQYPGRVFPVTISFFNDHPDTTFADIRLVLEKAVAEEEG